MRGDKESENRRSDKGEDENGSVGNLLSCQVVDYFLVNKSQTSLNPDDVSQSLTFHSWPFETEFDKTLLKVSLLACSGTPICMWSSLVDEVQFGLLFHTKCANTMTEQTSSAYHSSVIGLNVPQQASGDCYVIWSQSLRTSDCRVEPGYRVPTHTPVSSLISSKAQLSIMMLYPFFIASQFHFTRTLSF